ncbi:MAG: hypothetical protein K2Y16_13860 [Burkholderiales bacterium]|nr:hypothetical protein [Burkholderiales bacterium]
MKLPNARVAVVPDSKISGYLLSDIHPVGRVKARFFSGFGFSGERPGELADALKRLAQTYEVLAAEASPFGMRYIIDGVLGTPDGRNPTVRTVWFVGTGEAVPRFVTAFPASRR